MQYLFGTLLFVVGGMIGLKFADLDHAFRLRPFLDHRSLLTHGFLVPLLLFNGFRKHTDVTARLFVMGFCLASAVHLTFDIVVWRLIGYARIHVPFYGWTDPLFSRLWMLAGILVCLYLACLLVRNIGEFYLGFAGMIVMYGVCAAAEPRLAFYALVVLALAAPVAFVLPRRAVWKDTSPG